MRTTTTVARPGARWVMAAMAALALAMSVVVTGLITSHDAAASEDLPRLTADPATGPVTKPNPWSLLATTAECPSNADLIGPVGLIDDPADPSYEESVPVGEGSMLFGGYELRSVVDMPPAGSYEIIAFCAIPEVVDGSTIYTYTPLAAAWLTYNEATWQITPAKPSAETTTVTLEAIVDGEPVTEIETGAEVELTATMVPAEATGSVEFFDSHPDHDEPVSLGEADVSSGTATIALDDLEAGEYVLTAGFTPEDAAEFAESQTAAGIPLTVNDPAAVQTTTTLTVAPESPVEVGAEVTMTATVAPGEAAGTVQFRAGTENVGEAVPVESGTAELTTTDLPEGELSLTASFSPTDPAAFAASTSTPVPYTVGDAGPQVTAVDAEGNPLGDNPVLQDGQVVTLTAPGFQVEEEVTITLDAGTETEEVLAEPIPADDGGAVVTEFTATALEPGQHQLDFAGAAQTLSWQFQMAGETGEEDGTDDATEDGADDGADGGTDSGTDAGTAGGAGGAAGGNANPSGNLAQTGVFVVGPAVLLALAAVSAGYAFIRRSKRDELLTFDDPNPAA